MECDEVLKKLSLYLDQETDRDQIERIENHIRHCPACLKELDCLKKMDASLNGIMGEELSKGFHSKLIREVEALSTSKANAKLKKRSFASILERLDRVCAVLVSGKVPWTMDSFDDFPPWSLGHAYVKLIHPNP